MDLLITFLIGVVLLAFFLSQLLDLIDRRDDHFPSPNDRLIWVLVVLLVPVIGAMLYFISKPARTPKSSDHLKSVLARARQASAAKQGLANEP